MEYLDQFMDRYAREIDYYAQVGALVQARLENSLKEAGIRAIVTSRPKSIARLRDKCVRRQADRGPYSSVENIYQDIKDLAGVRVALYFPGEQEQVDGLIGRMFQVESRKDKFTSDSGIDRPKRFSGYSAVHYGVRLREESLAEQEQRYATARVEVQVASVLMHAWSEVEHDLVYKPLNGDLSPEEYAILDQLNGLVLAGEISLERLQEAGQRRVSAAGSEFSNHYDLASYLLGQTANIVSVPINEAGLGRVDVLFNFLSRLDLASKEGLSSYVEQLHSDIERRPIAEQLVDLLIDEDSQRLEVYQQIRGIYGSSASDVDVDVSRSIGEFVSAWIELERLLSLVVPNDADRRFNVALLTREASKVGAIDERAHRTIDLLRRVRNNVVHGVEGYPAEYLDECTQQVIRIHQVLRDYLMNSED